MTIAAVDLFIIVVYLLGILFVGLWSVRKIKRQTSESYFLASRNLKWPVVGAALFASNISTIHLVGLAESGFGVGMVVGNYEWMASFTIILLSLVFVPIYFRSRITTLPEFMERRYSPAARTTLSFMFIMSAMLIHIGISLYAGAAVFERFFGIPSFASITMISIITVIYTVVGGLRAVVVTETIQTVILLGGAILITVIAMTRLPGVGIDSYGELLKATKPNQLSMIHLPGEEGFDPGSIWYGFLLGFPILGLWYWCTDQTIVQRVLGAGTLRDAQHGALFASLLKFLPPLFMVLPGVFAYVLFRDIITEPTDALPTLITELLPTGLIGIMAAALLAALMSSDGAPMGRLLAARNTSSRHVHPALRLRGRLHHLPVRHGLRIPRRRPVRLRSRERPRNPLPPPGLVVLLHPERHLRGHQPGDAATQGRADRRPDLGQAVRVPGPVGDHGCPRPAAAGGATRRCAGGDVRPGSVERRSSTSPRTRQETPASRPVGRRCERMPETTPVPVSRRPVTGPNARGRLVDPAPSPAFR